LRQANERADHRNTNVTSRSRNSPGLKRNAN
jgi:hypothetical protein